MMQQGLKYFTEIPLTVLGMMLFFVTYLGVLTFTLWRKDNREQLKQLSQLPLNEENQL